MFQHLSYPCLWHDFLKKIFAKVTSKKQVYWILLRFTCKYFRPVVSFSIFSISTPDNSLIFKSISFILFERILSLQSKIVEFSDTCLFLFIRPVVWVHLQQIRYYRQKIRSFPFSTRRPMLVMDTRMYALSFYKLHVRLLRTIQSRSNIKVINCGFDGFYSPY